MGITLKSGQQDPVFLPVVFKDNASGIHGSGRTLIGCRTVHHAGIAFFQQDLCRILSGAEGSVALI